MFLLWQLEAKPSRSQSLAPPPKATAVTVALPTPSEIAAPIVADAVRTDSTVAFDDCHVNETPGIGAPKTPNACAVKIRPPVHRHRRVGWRDCHQPDRWQRAEFESIVRTLPVPPAVPAEAMTRCGRIEGIARDDLLHTVPPDLGRRSGKLHREMVCRRTRIGHWSLTKQRVVIVCDPIQQQRIRP